MKYKRNEQRKVKREQHEARVSAWQSLSPEEQLAALDLRHGKGKGAAKQRARLA